jgi:hypothetical protein
MNAPHGDAVCHNERRAATRPFDWDRFGKAEYILFDEGSKRSPGTSRGHVGDALR